MAAIAGLLVILDVLLAVGCYSLRDFSRSRLEQVCRRRDNAERFGLILKQYERALLISDFLSVVAIVGVIIFFAVWLDLLQSQVSEPRVWFVLGCKWSLFAASVLLFHVIIPWSAARVAGESFLYRAWPLLHMLIVFSKPLWTIAAAFDRALHRVRGLEEPQAGDMAALNEEIRSVVDEGERSGVLESDAMSMIHRVMELKDEDVAAIMTPRTDMVCIPIDATLEQARQRLLDAGHTRVPVIGDSPDEIEGILYAKDLLQFVQAGTEETRLTDIAREPFYVPETTGLDTLLERMRREHVHLAVVLDEYGGVSGLVTLEDILEEIVGEIVDEYDATVADPIRYLEPTVAEVDARTHIDDVNDQFDLELPEDNDYDTIGGFVFAQLGSVPEPGATLDWQHAKITVLEADKRRILKLRIQVDESRETTAGDE